MVKRMALNTSGEMTYCTAPADKIGMGRCNHTFHQKEGENTSDFVNRVNDKKKTIDNMTGLGGDIEVTYSNIDETKHRDLAKAIGESVSFAEMVQEENDEDIFDENPVPLEPGDTNIKESLTIIARNNPDVARGLAMESKTDILLYSGSNEDPEDIIIYHKDGKISKLNVMYADEDGERTGVFDNDEFKEMSNEEYDGDHMKYIKKAEEKGLFDVGVAAVGH